MKQNKQSTKKGWRRLPDMYYVTRMKKELGLTDEIIHRPDFPKPDKRRQKVDYEFCCWYYLWDKDKIHAYIESNPDVKAQVEAYQVKQAKKKKR